MYVILSSRESMQGEIIEAVYQSDELDLGHLAAYAPGSVVENTTTGKTYILGEDKEWELVPAKVETAEAPETAVAETEKPKASKSKTAKAKTTK